jgi:hypothetical protein
VWSWINKHTSLGSLEFTAAEQELMGFIQAKDLAVISVEFLQ